MGAALAEKVAGAQFTSHGTPKDVYVELGFVPDYVRVVVDQDGTNSNLLEWWNPAGFFSIGITGYLLTTGSSGNRTKVTTTGQIIEAYAGHDKIAADETNASDPSHVTRAGAYAAEGHITAAGILIPAEAQVASGKVLITAYRIGD